MAISSQSVRNDSSTIATNISSISPRRVASNLIDSPLAFRIRIKAISRAGVTLAEAMCGVAVIPGSFLTKQFKPREGATAPRDVSGPTGRMVHQTSRCFARPNDARSVSWHREFCRRGEALRREKIHRLRNRRELPCGGEAPFELTEAMKRMPLAQLLVLASLTLAFVGTVGGASL